MSTFEIYPGQIDGISGKYGNAGMTVHSIAGEIESIMNSLRLGNNTASVSVRNSLKATAASMEKYADRLNRMQSGLVSIAAWYRNADGSVAGWQNGIMTAETTSESIKKNLDENWPLEELVRVLLKSSDAGNLMAAFLSSGMISGLSIFSETDPKEWNKGISELIVHFLDLKIGDKYDSFYDCAMDYLGLAKYSEDVIVPDGRFWNNFISSLDDELNDYNLAAYTDDSFLKNARSTIKTAAKWFDVVFEFYGEAMENLEEGNSAVRTASEIMIESGVDIGLDWLVGSAFAAALGTFGAPVVVGGIAGGVAVYAANSVCEWAFGKDIGEVVSDTLCDGAEKIGNALGDGLYDLKESVKDGIEDLKKAGKKACKSVSDWWKEVTGG